MQWLNRMPTKFGLDDATFDHGGLARTPPALTVFMIHCRQYSYLGRNRRFNIATPIVRDDGLDLVNDHI